MLKFVFAPDFPCAIDAKDDVRNPDYLLATPHHVMLIVMAIIHKRRAMG